MPLSAGVEAHEAMGALLQRHGERYAAVVTFRPTGWAYSKSDEARSSLDAEYLPIPPRISPSLEP